MPIEIIKSAQDQPLLQVKDLTADFENGKYRLNMNPGQAEACVVGVSRSGPIPAEELQKLSKEELDQLWFGKIIKNEEKGYTLIGIRSGMVAAGEYGSLDIDPPIYLQAWAMTAEPIKGRVLYVPQDTASRTTLIPVFYHVIQIGNGFKVEMQQTDGYNTGDLLYQVEKDHLPIPIPQDWVNEVIPLNCNMENLKVFPDEDVKKKYIEKK